MSLTIGMLGWAWMEEKEPLVCIYCGELGKEGVLRKIKGNNDTLNSEILKINKVGYEEPNGEYGWECLFLGYNVYEISESEYEKLFIEGYEDEEIVKLTFCSGLENLLSKTGLGWVDSGYVSSIHPEITCYVYDCHLAKKIVIKEIELGILPKYDKIYISEHMK
jgi:hypothetical protein